MSDLFLAPDNMWDLEPLLEIWVHEGVRPAMVSLAGRLDRSTGKYVRDLLTRLWEQGHRDLIVDLTDVQITEKTAVAHLLNLNPPDPGRHTGYHVLFLGEVTSAEKDEPGVATPYRIRVRQSP